MSCTCRDLPRPEDDFIEIINPITKIRWWGRKTCPDHGIKYHTDVKPEPVPEPVVEEPIVEVTVEAVKGTTINPVIASPSEPVPETTTTIVVQDIEPLKPATEPKKKRTRKKRTEDGTPGSNTTL